MRKQDAPIKIGEHQYTFTQLDPRRAARIYTFLLARFGDSLSTAIGAIKPGKGAGLAAVKDGDFDMKGLGSAVGKMLMALDDDIAMAHIDTLLSSVIGAGGQMSLDHANFQGSMMHLTLVVKKAVEVNYADFLGENSVLVGKLKALFHTIQESQTSTGSSGGPSSAG